MIQKPALLFAFAIFLQPLAFAQESVQWGSSEKPAVRQSIDGMKMFYEPAKVEHNGDVYSFTLYRSGTPTVSDEAGRYMINCETREFVSVTNGQSSPPSKLLPGEELYPIGKKLCEWDQKNFYNKFFN